MHVKDVVYIVFDQIGLLNTKHLIAYIYAMVYQSLRRNIWC